MNPPCPHCRRQQTQAVSERVEAARSNPSESRLDCVAKSYGIRPLSERLALPPKPTLAECYLAGSSIFIGEETEFGDKVTLGAPDWAQDDYRELCAQWEISRLLWERLWYCEGCDSVFDPETRVYEASKDLALLIRV
jgi:hypothetical protein